MDNSSAKNANRFLGFANTYDEARPIMPFYPIKVIQKYLGKKPDKVIDLGCGTGLSTIVWTSQCNEVIGIEPSEDMISIARKKQVAGISFIKAFSHDTGISDNFADVVVCSQSFHWMDPMQTLNEVNRILNYGGVFATVDCDWPPVCYWVAEQAYNQLFKQVSIIESETPELQGSFIKWDKNNHLRNIQNSDFFRYSREIVFSNDEKCNADRFINLALSQGGLQSILKFNSKLIILEVNKFKEAIYSIFGDKDYNIDFCYRMRIGVK